ncbi:MAG: glycosyltransferase family 4 protein [Chloroflexota bacterium]|nr:MAG: glycosyltransferase family 4 protein [Chloroflexota bacterium]
MTRNQVDHQFRILHIILGLTPTNGQYNEHCLPLRKTRDITICTYFKSEITPPEEITLYDGDSTMRGFFRALGSSLKERDYDVIHVHTPHAGLLLLVYLFFSGLYGKLKSSTVHTVQNSYENFRVSHQIMFLPSFAFFQYLVFCSKSAEESFPTIFKWLARGRMQVVQNTVDIDRIDNVINRIDQDHPSDQFEIVTVGLIPMKNPLTMMAAYQNSLNRSGKLIYLGEGKLRPSVENEAKQNGLENQVTLTGMIARDQVFQHYAQADLFVSTSWGEGLPVAVLEAMACRSPVLLSDIPPHREIAEDMEFIPLIKPDDVDGFAREIKRFHEMSRQERNDIGQKCREIIEEKFTISTMHNAYAKIYSQITGSQISTLLTAAN